MSLSFDRKEETFVFFDGKGEKVERKTEVRFDPLTGESSRLVFDAGLAPAKTDYNEAAEQTGGKNCPFCSENILAMTPVFPTEIAEEGRIRQGEAILFPNLFPYSKYNGVVVFSGKHYVNLEEFTVSMIRDAFLAAQTFIQRVAAIDPDAKYASINWNYLPASGGSILHPHLHVIISDTPTNTQAMMSEKLEQFRDKKGSHYFSELAAAEKEAGERWIGTTCSIDWLHAFAPKSHHDVIAVFSNAYCINDISERNWENFAKGLTNIFAGLDEAGFSSFNLSLTLPAHSSLRENVTARIVPRLTMGMLGTSDINFFQMLHQEPLTYKRPEDVAADYRRIFAGQ